MTQADMTSDKRARLICSWCEAEGKSLEASTIGWTKTFDGEPSHGMCKYHFDTEIAKMDARDAEEKEVAR